MANIWFTGDQHFNHERVIDYCNRPFNRVSQMNNVIIARYRQVVLPEDTVYFLGDLTLAGPSQLHSIEYIVSQLPGRKILILGNHDKLNPFHYVDMGFESVHTMLDIGEFILVHDPAYVNERSDRRWLVAHVHNVFKLAKNNTVLNVGVDQHSFYPISLTEVNKFFSTP